MYFVRYCVGVVVVEVEVGVFWSARLVDYDACLMMSPCVCCFFDDWNQRKIDFETLESSEHKEHISLHI